MKYFPFFKIQCTTTQICNTSRSNTKVMTWGQLSVLLKNPPKGDTIFLQNIGMTETRIVERICRVISPSFISFLKIVGKVLLYRAKGEKPAGGKIFKVRFQFFSGIGIEFPSPYFAISLLPHLIKQKVVVRKTFQRKHHVEDESKGSAW